MSLQFKFERYGVLKIGEFSKLSMVTVKALRFYDEIGLLKPKQTDKWSGYRYYDNDQLFEISRIVALKQAGLSTAEIKSVVQGGNVYEILEERKKLVENELASNTERLMRIAKLIKDLKENKQMSFQVTIKEVPEYVVFSGVAKLKNFAELSDFILGIGTECAKANPDVKCISPDYCFVSYLDKEFTPTDFTAMYAQAVEKSGVDTKNVKFITMPKVKVASVFVKGEYGEHLPQGYAYAIKWIEENGYKISDLPRERYIDGCWNVESPDDYLTEIQIPIE